MREIVGGMASAIGVTLADRSISRWAADAIGGLCEAAWRTLPLRGTLPLTRHVAMVMSRDCTLRGDKAREELGYHSRITVEEGLAGLHT